MAFLGNPDALHSYTDLFAKEAGKSVKVGSLPNIMVRILGLFSPMIREVAEMLYQFERDFTLDSPAFEDHFGWKATPIETAVRDTWKAHIAG